MSKEEEFLKNINEDELENSVKILERIKKEELDIEKILESINVKKTETIVKYRSIPRDYTPRGNHSAGCQEIPLSLGQRQYHHQWERHNKRGAGRQSVEHSGC